MDNDSRQMKELLKLARENNEMLQSQHGELVSKRRQAMAKRILIVALIGVGAFYANKHIGSIMTSYEEVKVKAEETQQKLESANQLRLDLEENIKSISGTINRLQGLTGAPGGSQ